ncbi:TlpA family protein disulfide reductase [Dictyoglomus thermophilum]|uniref:TlpA family protein disulfide reductase n=1 Tax=Dictyoglomus thermophilum TaxID=14 RepID=UPI0005A288C6|nr:TlpA disulfide reductase family protein [Dictyoglomus thermophilum]MCX7721094.1 TlpA family protein disulfide reductase [Dictyoglomus thermophilum]TYT22546.1 TlpA family protein disulfide reductase [Dictyoglomus thermophilum]
MRKIFKLRIIFILVFMVILSSTLVYSKQPQVSENSPAVDFTLPDIKGKKYTLSSFKGNVVLLNFWATWCPPCRYEVPMLDRIQKEYKNEKFKVVAVSLDSDVNSLKEYLKSVSISFLVLSDSKGSVGYIYNILAIPTSFLIDKKFIVRKIYLGILPEKEFKKDLEKWLKD